ncbi:type VI secretion system tip protein VgrG [Burkholderia sp. Ac-20353]|uniref:type VI secretion system Vgr family protein n=1 Tax=Burkholderia sp. Ac-20353 TaxID=2703894 RepID=UPI00197B847C|nr:type VI secretion system tip protein VgrG [Burkholderia sp. Ac-20353]MBN3787868.1 type VI secretion system tip protein VgrG [Burkholderia sp. Ac-20353]
MATSKDILQALLGGWAQHDRFLRLTTPLGQDALVAESVDGWESIDGGGYRFELTALTENPALPIARLVGGPVLVEWLTADGGREWRPFHAHVAAAELIGYNGGLARVRLVLEPWLAILRQRIDSYHYHDATVIDISEQIFGYYTRGAVFPAWRWELADQTRYLRRSLTVQAGESDFDFLSRLWAEEGLYYWFEHAADPGAKSLGGHTLVLADSNERFLPREPERVPFHHTGESDPAGGIRHFMLARRWRIGRVARASWDYRSLSARPAAARASGAVVPGEDRDVAGPYAYQTAALGDQRSQQQLDALRVDAARSEGDGTRRDLRPGLRFFVDHHPTLGASDEFVCLRVQHRARANVSADIRTAIGQHLGAIPLMRDADAGGTDAASSVAPSDDTSRQEAFADEDAVYGNRFFAMPAAQPYRPSLANGQGVRSQPAAMAQGAQSAIVVGSGDPVHTERDHRIRVQHHTQRGEKAASRESHPHVPNAPANRGAGTWTRVLTPVGGANWGGVTIPRVGQEVWTELLEGQPDRPVAVAALYNGKGNANAQHNALVGGPSGSTGNAAAWFAGNDHPAALTGFKTQDLGQSRSGTGGYRQFLVDDTAGQSRAHLYTTDRNSGLTLGHIKQQHDNRRLADRGYGVELATDAAGALRGGAGLLITTAAGTSQMDARAPGLDLAEGLQRAQSLVEAAQRQGAGVGAAGQEPPPDQLPATQGLKQTREALAETRSGGTATGGGGGGSAVAWSRPHLVAHGADGIVAVSARSHVWVSGKETVFSAGQDLQVTAQGKTSVIANHGISLYTQGSAGNGRVVDGKGIALHAASGSASVQAQSGGTLAAAAQRAVTLASVDAGATLQAKQRLLLTAADAFIKMEGSDIVVGGPGKVAFKAASHDLTGPQSASGSTTLARSQATDCPQTMGDMIASSAACADL